MFEFLFLGVFANLPSLIVELTASLPLSKIAPELLTQIGKFLQLGPAAGFASLHDQADSSSRFLGRGPSGLGFGVTEMPRRKALVEEFEERRAIRLGLLALNVRLP
jgi:hypothetical protein